MSEPAEPIPFRLNERVRVHAGQRHDDAAPDPPARPLLRAGDGAWRLWSPRKHTVNVPPGGTVTFDVTADAPATGRSTATISTT